MTFFNQTNVRQIVYMHKFIGMIGLERASTALHYCGQKSKHDVAVFSAAGKQDVAFVEIKYKFLHKPHLVCISKFNGASVIA